MPCSLCADVRWVCCTYPDKPWIKKRRAAASAVLATPARSAIRLITVIRRRPRATTRLIMKALTERPPRVGH